MLSSKLCLMFGMYVSFYFIECFLVNIFHFSREKKELEEEMNRRSVRDMEARQQCFKAECEIRQLKKEMRRDKLQLKELEQQLSQLKSKSKSRYS